MKQEIDIRSYEPGENIFSLLKPTKPAIEETGLNSEDLFFELKYPQPHTLIIKDRIGGVLYSSPEYPKIHIETHATLCHILHIDTDDGSSHRKKDRRRTLLRMVCVEPCYRRAPSSQATHHDRIDCAQ